MWVNYTTSMIGFVQVQLWVKGNIYHLQISIFLKQFLNRAASVNKFICLVAKTSVKQLYRVVVYLKFVWVTAMDSKTLHLNIVIFSGEHHNQLWRSAEMFHKMHTTYLNKQYIFLWFTCQSVFFFWHFRV